MIDPDLHYQLWKYEHSQQVRTAERVQAVREAARSRAGVRIASANGAMPSSNYWLSLLNASVLRLRKLFAVSRPARYL
jgi:hypothetical protein